MKSEVRSLSERWFRAWLEKDAAVVDELAAEDYLYVAPNGTVLDRRGILRVVRSPTYRLERGERTEVVVRAVGREAATVRHHYRGEGSFEGEAFSDDQRCVMVWERRADRWRLVMEQCSFAGRKR
jgi:ketosteroid isomerase-like protein